MYTDPIIRESTLNKKCHDAKDALNEHEENDNHRYEVMRTEFSSAHDKMDETIGHIHKRVDAIYRHLLEGK